MVETLKVDILQTELEQNLPYWLDPSQKNAERHAEIRAKHRQRWLDEQKREKSWQQAKRQAALLLKKFDPSQPRDEHGRWTDTGGSDDSLAEDTIGGYDRIPGLPPGTKIRDPSDSIATALNRDAFDMTAEKKERGPFDDGDTYHLTITSKLAPGIEPFESRPGQTRYYDPRLARLETIDAGTIIERTYARPKDTDATEIQPLEGEKIIYRGISAEEYQAILETGKVSSKGEYNIGEDQRGLTYWTTKPNTAASYASGFAPWQFAPTFTKPAYVIAARMPEETREVPGTGENEVGVARPIERSELLAVWRGDVYSHTPGEIDLKQIGSSDTYRMGSASHPNSPVVWSREDQGLAEDTVGYANPAEETTEKATVGGRTYPVRDNKNHVIDTSRMRGAAIVYDDNTVSILHVTDTPEQVEQGLNDAPEDLTTAFGNEGDDLGAGFYGSAVPQIWMSRSAGKWDFLSSMTSAQKQDYVTYLRGKIEQQRSVKYITANEYERAVRDLGYFETGQTDYITWTAEQPYNIESWKPETLATLGITPGKQPEVMDIRLRGRFVDLTAGGFRQSDVEELQKRGYDGAYVQGSFSYTPQFVIWNKAAITEIKRSKHAR
jgi:hypothetical protein